MVSLEFSAGRLARWAIGLGVGVHLLGFLVFRVVAEPTERPPLPPAFVDLALITPAVNSALLEQTALFDSEPLFLPTRWNASLEEVISVQSPPVASPFDPFPPELAVEQVEVEAVLRPPPPLPGSPLDVLAINPGAVFAIFGQVAPLEREPHGGLVVLEVLDFESGVPVARRKVARADLAFEVPDDWRLIEFLVLVTPTGALGPPLLLIGSGDETLDSAWSGYLTRPSFIPDLPPGYYRVKVGP